MGIDLRTETLIAINRVPKHLPPTARGKAVHLATVYRWLARGTRGRRLESILVGGSRYTSIEALQRFCDAASAEPPRHVSNSCSRSPPAATKSANLVEAELDRLGI